MARNDHHGPWGSPPAEEPGPEPPADKTGARPRVPPRRSPPSRPPAGPTRLDGVGRRVADEARRLQDGLSRWGPPPAAIPIAIAAALLGWAASGVYLVQADQAGVVTRLGAFAGVAGPGLGYHLPAPLGAVQKVSVARANETVVGGGDTAGAASREVVLTADGNLAAVGFVVDWKVKDPRAYLRNVRHPDGLVQVLAEDAVRQAVARVSFGDLLVGGRAAAEERAAVTLQQGLAAAGAGIEVEAVRIRSAGPAPAAAPAFDDISAAAQDSAADRDAAGDRSKKALADAQSQGAVVIAQAEATRAQAVSQAQAEVARFAGALAAWRANPDLTRSRIYAETLEAILAHSRKIVVDAHGVAITPSQGTAPVQVRPLPTPPGDKAPR
ncbi:MAG TPA: protease modulator HflK [Caulobacteraceae bacterium]|nr:protease modulator HflK [Caulobacteraceae bacterium]